jgi:hypothetical protein
MKTVKVILKKMAVWFIIPCEEINMVRCIQNLTILGVLSFLILLSCSSAPASSVREDTPLAYESMQIGRERVSETANDNRMITYSVSLELSVKNTDETRKMLVEQVKNHGGFIVNETEYLIIARIPSENMDNFMNNARTLGKTVNETKNGTDITDQYRDNVIRLESYKNIRNRYLALLEKATTVNDMLSIERELERINMEIERLEGRIRHAELSVEYSNITVRFREKAKPGPVSWIFYGLYRGIKWFFIWD